MTNTQRAKLDSYNRIADFNTKYATILTTVNEYTQEQTAFTNAVAIIKSASGVQTQTTVAPDTVNTVKLTMADTVFKLALRGMVKAKQSGNIPLANQLDEPLSYIYQATKTVAVQRAKNMRDLLNDNLATLINIAAADITAMDTAITAYDSTKDQLTQTIQVKKASGTNVLPDAFKTADEAASNMYDLVRSYFEAGNTAMADEMKLAISIISTGLRHTDIAFTVLADDTGNPIVNAAVTDNATGKIYNTDAEGLAGIAKHRHGHFTFSIAYPGRQTVAMGADIVQGTHNTFTVRLKVA